MKRSEMITKLSEWLTYNCPDENTTSYWRKEQASSLLNLIERSGMLPPETEIVVYYSNVIGPITDRYADFKNEWEEE